MLCDVVGALGCVVLVWMFGRLCVCVVVLVVRVVDVSWFVVMVSLIGLVVCL